MNKRISLYITIVVLIIAALSLFSYSYLKNNNSISKVTSTKTLEPTTPEATNTKTTTNLDLNLLMEKLNNATDKSLIIESFKRIKIISDPLYDLPEYSGGDKNPETNKYSSVSYGVEGTYKVTDSVNVHISIINDDTDKNGGYIITRSGRSFETSFFKYNRSYLIFEVYEQNSDNKKISQDMIKVQEFKQKFSNTYKNIYSYISLK